MLRKWRHCGSDLSREGVSTLPDQPYIEGGGFGKWGIIPALGGLMIRVNPQEN